MLEIIAYTDGSCLGNPGVGGYAGVMLAKGKKRICAGYEKTQTTNNRMELRAAIKVVDWITNVQKEASKVTFFTDSQYLVNCFKHSWSELTSAGRANNDLWAEFIRKCIEGNIQVDFVKIKGHADDKYNKEADKLARAQAVKARHLMYGG